MEREVSRPRRTNRRCTRERTIEGTAGDKGRGRKRLESLGRVARSDVSCGLFAGPEGRSRFRHSNRKRTYYDRGKAARTPGGTPTAPEGTKTPKTPATHPNHNRLVIRATPGTGRREGTVQTREAGVIGKKACRCNSRSLVGELGAQNDL